jgi:hypothetical protein
MRSPSDTPRSESDETGSTSIVERSVWFVAGAIGGVLGIAGLSGLLWFSLSEDWGLLVLAAIAGTLGLALIVRRRGGRLAARLWAILAWFVFSGLAFDVWVSLAAAIVPIPPRAPTTIPVQAVLVDIGWAAVTGGLAVLLLVVASKLVRRRG